MFDIKKIRGVIMKIKVKEVKEWMNTLDENKWRKTYNVDARRVAHFAKNILEGEELILPRYLQRKSEGYEYKREKKLAKEYTKVFKRKLKESKKTSNIRKIIREILKEEDSEYQKFFRKACERFDIDPSDIGTISDEEKKKLFNYIDKN
jgi:hypothetical protein